MTEPAATSPTTSVSGSAVLALDLSDRPDAPLGTLLFRAGLVPEDDLRDALEHSIQHGRRLGEVLLDRRLIEERDLARILAGQKGLPFVDVRELEVDPEAVPLLSEEQARLLGALPIAFEDSVPLVAVGDPSNRHLFGQIGEALGRKPRFAVAVPSDLDEAIAAAYALVPSIRPAPEPATVPPVERREEAEPAARILVLLTNGERVEAGPPLGPAAALEQAKSLIRSIDERRPGEWPFAAGRFLRPDAIVSVDVVELGDGGR